MEKIFQIKKSVILYFIFQKFTEHVTAHGSDAGCSKEFSKASGSKTPASLIVIFTAEDHRRGLTDGQKQLTCKLLWFISNIRRLYVMCRVGTVCLLS